MKCLALREELLPWSGEYLCAISLLLYAVVVVVVVVVFYPLGTININGKYHGNSALTEFSGGRSWSRLKLHSDGTCKAKLRDGKIAFTHRGGFAPGGESHVSISSETWPRANVDVQFLKINKMFIHAHRQKENRTYLHTWSPRVLPYLNLISHWPFKYFSVNLKYLKKTKIKRWQWRLCWA